VSRPAPMAATGGVAGDILLIVGAVSFFRSVFLSPQIPEWRLLSWLLALIVVMSSLSFLYRPIRIFEYDVRRAWRDNR